MHPNASHPNFGYIWDFHSALRPADWQHISWGFRSIESIGRPDAEAPYQSIYNTKHLSEGYGSTRGPIATARFCHAGNQGRRCSRQETEETSAGASRHAEPREIVTQHIVTPSLSDGIPRPCKRGDSRGVATLHMRLACCHCHAVVGTACHTVFSPPSS